MDKAPETSMRGARTAGERAREAQIYRHYYTKSMFDWWITHPYRRNTLAPFFPHIEQLIQECPSPLVIVEVASGAGVNLTNLLMRYSHLRGFGFDISPEGVRVATKYGKGTYFMGDAEHTALADECCDIVLLVSVIHHFHHYPDKLLAEVSRILRQGGYVFVVEPNGWRVRPFWFRSATWVSRKAIHLFTRLFRGSVYQVEIPEALTEKPMTQNAIRQVITSQFEVIDAGFREMITFLTRHCSRGHRVAQFLDNVIGWVQPNSMHLCYFVARKVQLGETSMEPVF